MRNVSLRGSASRWVWLLLLSAPVLAQTNVSSLTITADTTAGGMPLVIEDLSLNLPSVPQAELRGRLARIEKQIPLTYHPAVQSYVDLFAFRKTSYVRRMLAKESTYFPMYEKMFAKYGLPDELKYLSVVESALNPKALSSAKALGLWQFMSATAGDMRLRQDDVVDERMDPERSTDAACRYLRDLYRVFGDWHLVMAAYNSGAGTVKRAMRRSGGDSFWTIYDFLPKETRGYVPLFIATTYIMRYADEHGLKPERMEWPIPHDTIRVSGYVNMELLARHSGWPLEELQALNPQLRTDELPDWTENFVLRVPTDRLHEFAPRRLAILDSARQRTYAPNVLLADAEDVAPEADTLLTRIDEAPILLASARDGLEFLQSNVAEESPAVIAEALEEDVAEEEESSTPKTTKHAAHRAAKHVAHREMRAKLRYHKVQGGDTLWNIAQRYGKLSIDELKKKNKIRGNNLRPGQRLIVG